MFREGDLNCSFCGKGQKEVKKLIAGPGVYICDRCVILCNRIIKESDVQVREDSKELYTPKEIKSTWTSTWWAKRGRRGSSLWRSITTTRG